MRLIIWSIIFFSAISCNTVKNVWLSKKQPITVEKNILARVTYYDPTEDRWGSRVADPTEKRAKQGHTVAANKNFKFGTKIKIPELEKVLDKDDEFIVMDRGSAVEKSKADWKFDGKAHVIDVYVEDPKMKRFLTVNYPDYMNIIVYD